MEEDAIQKHRHLLSEDRKVRRWPKKNHERQFVLEYLES